MTPGGVTVTLVQSTDSGCSCTVMCGASWYERCRRDSDGRHLGETAVRIPASEVTALPRPGDLLIRGEAGDITTLQQAAEHPYIRVNRVHDNRRGRLRHVGVWGT